MGYVDKNLARGERVVYMAHLHKAMFGPAIALLVGSLLMATVGITNDSGGAFLLAFLFFGAATVLFLQEFALYKTTEMAVTNRRIIGKQGLISRKTIEVNNTMVGGVQVDQGIIDRLINRGTITVTGAGAPENPFTGIARPLDFRRQALQAVDRRQR